MYREDVCSIPDGIDSQMKRPSHGSYSINGALELMARSSIGSLRNGRLSNLSTISMMSQSTNQIINEANWSWKHLRDEFQKEELETQCKRYTHRLSGGFFVVYLLLNFILFMSHLIIVIVANILNHETQADVKKILPDIIFYTCAAIFPTMFFIIKDKYTKKYNWLYPCASCFTVTILVLFDLSISNIHSSTHFYLAYPPLRPAHIEHILIGCYAFLPVEGNFQATVLGITTTVCYLLSLTTVTYRKQDHLFTRLLSDAVYFICINGLGIYLRLINEIIVRRMFLDARNCVRTTMKLKFQKNKEERLMFSILPPHVKRRVKDDIETMYHLMINKNVVDYDNIKPINDLYIEEHSDVTILYADIVNYTKMTSTVPVKKLVNILNELFGSFDDASEERKVVRIKFLGDCYYCVAGIPQVGDPTAHLNHAKKAIDFGLDMITIIRVVRERHDLDIDMRIGVHSGRIISGLVGSCKWQYDIWSKDVVIANRMEQTGRAGKIHLTNRTLSKINDDEYFCERAYGETNNPFFLQNRITTYLISLKNDDPQTSPPPLVPLASTSQQSHSLPSTPSLFDKRTSVSASSSRVSNQAIRGKSSIRFKKMSRDEEINFISPISNRRSLFMNDVNREYLEMLTLVDNTMAEEIEKLPLGKFEQWYKNKYINPLFLTFKNCKWEWSYGQQPDPLFKFYILAVICIFFSIFIIQFLTYPWKNSLTWICYLTVITLLSLLIPFTWSQYIWTQCTKHKNKNDKMEDMSKPPTNPIILFLNRCSNGIVFSSAIRICIFILTCVLMTLCTFVELHEGVFCTPDNSTGLVRINKIQNNCIKPWHMTETVSLIIFANFLFIRINHFLKVIMAIAIATFYSFQVWNYRYRYYEFSASWNLDLRPQISHILSVAYVTLILFILDRRHEYMNHLDFQWKMRLTKEIDEATTTENINTMLLHNILPMHVAKIYMDPDREDRSYYEEYSSVSVIFASLTGYTLGVDDDSQENELIMLRVLNYIICDFDRLLTEHPGTKIEKIKMAGWTYMAACGLEPGKRDSQSNLSADVEQSVVVTLTKFATKLMKALHTINQETQQNFQLRIGISHGKVSAGVVGAKKPLYDIWGDTVNMASRMDSTGKPNKIQVTSGTAEVLQNQDILCDLRGNIFVKGKNMVKTFFVKLDENFDFTSPNTTDL